ncbi:hypothetical protein M9H77_03739 [Catharanthus roseus]|uniref:Uncharacterized protein n=1 Tax=Catharanthus roseus TaxID=4058 RepID=A0ACC0CCK3_CATRO|nr:hypothetical protein M9H77_03739 [Catharanthus roseus]
MKIINKTLSGREEQSVIPKSEEDRLRERNPSSFPSIKKTTQIGMGANESYNPSNDEDDESSKEEERVEGRRNMEKELGPILEGISISLSLNPSSLCNENIFLLVPSMKICLSSHLSLEDPLMSSSVMFEPSCYGLSNLDGTSLVELNMLVFALEFDGNSLQLVCLITSTRRRRHTKEFEGEGEDVGEKLILCYGD